MISPDSSGKKKRIFSGMQPSGEAHLGNYLGALRRWVAMQDDYDCIWCIVDQHAITAGGDPSETPGNVLDLAISFLAVGLDPEKAIIFVQSDVPEHTELAWLFNAVTPVGDLERMTQFKDKSQRFDSIPSGILNYPILQAADILLYKADGVPVGEDQKQHLELARDIAQKFNNDFCAEDAPLFTLPDPIIPPEAARIMSLRDGSAKMSKSDPSDMSRINLTDDADAIMQKVKKAKTDPEPLPGTVEGLAGRPEANNLVGIYAAMAGTTPADVLVQFEGKGFGQFKPALGELLVETLSPMAARYRELREDGEALDAILAKGALKARDLAAPTLAKTYQALGLVRG